MASRKVEEYMGRKIMKRERELSTRREDERHDKRLKGATRNGR